MSDTLFWSACAFRLCCVKATSIQESVKYSAESIQLFLYASYQVSLRNAPKTCRLPLLFSRSVWVSAELPDILTLLKVMRRTKGKTVAFISFYDLICFRVTRTLSGVLTVWSQALMHNTSWQLHYSKHGAPVILQVVVSLMQRGTRCPHSSNIAIRYLFISMLQICLRAAQINGSLSLPSPPRLPEEASDTRLHHGNASRRGTCALLCEIREKPLFL